jgi:hypothetical protein
MLLDKEDATNKETWTPARHSNPIITIELIREGTF